MGVVCDAPSIFEVVLWFHEMAVHMVRETLRTKNLIILESHPTDSKLGNMYYGTLHKCPGYPGNHQ